MYSVDENDPVVGQRSSTIVSGSADPGYLSAEHAAIVAFYLQNAPENWDWDLGSRHQRRHGGDIIVTRIGHNKTPLPLQLSFKLAKFSTDYSDCRHLRPKIPILVKSENSIEAAAPRAHSNSNCRS